MVSNIDEGASGSYFLPETGEKTHVDSVKESMGPPTSQEVSPKSTGLIQKQKETEITPQQMASLDTKPTSLEIKGIKSMYIILDPRKSDKNGNMSRKVHACLEQQQLVIASPHLFKLEWFNSKTKEDRVSFNDLKKIYDFFAGPNGSYIVFIPKKTTYDGMESISPQLLNLTNLTPLDLSQLTPNNKMGWESIFSITNPSYRDLESMFQRNNVSVPKLSIYLSGHGSMHTTINLPDELYTRFLDHLSQVYQNPESTPTFQISSCRPHGHEPDKLPNLLFRSVISGTSVYPTSIANTKRSLEILYELHNDLPHKEYWRIIQRALGELTIEGEQYILAIPAVTIPDAVRRAKFLPQEEDALILPIKQQRKITKWIKDNPQIQKPADRKEVTIEQLEDHHYRLISKTMIQSIPFQPAEETVATKRAHLYTQCIQTLKLSGTDPDIYPHISNRSSHIFETIEAPQVESLQQFVKSCCLHTEKVLGGYETTSYNTCLYVIKKLVLNKDEVYRDVVIFLSPKTGELTCSSCTKERTPEKKAAFLTSIVEKMLITEPSKEDLRTATQGREGIGDAYKFLQQTIFPDHPWIGFINQPNQLMQQLKEHIILEKRLEKFIQDNSNRNNQMTELLSAEEQLLLTRTSIKLIKNIILDRNYLDKLPCKNRMETVRFLFPESLDILKKFSKEPNKISFYLNEDLQTLKILLYAFPEEVIKIDQSPAIENILKTILTNNDFERVKLILKLLRNKNLDDFQNYLNKKILEENYLPNKLEDFLLYLAEQNLLSENNLAELAHLDASTKLFLPYISTYKKEKNRKIGLGLLLATITRGKSDLIRIIIANGLLPNFADKQFQISIKDFLVSSDKDSSFAKIFSGIHSNDPKAWKVIRDRLVDYLIKNPVELGLIKLLFEIPNFLDPLEAFEKAMKNRPPNTSFLAILVTSGTIPTPKLQNLSKNPIVYQDPNLYIALVEKKLPVNIVEQKNYLISNIQEMMKKGNPILLIHLLRRWRDFVIENKLDPSEIRKIQTEWVIKALSLQEEIIFSVIFQNTSSSLMDLDWEAIGQAKFTSSANRKRIDAYLSKKLDFPLSVPLRELLKKVVINQDLTKSCDKILEQELTVQNAKKLVDKRGFDHFKDILTSSLGERFFLKWKQIINQIQFENKKEEVDYVFAFLTHLYANEPLLIDRAIRSWIKSMQTRNLEEKERVDLCLELIEKSKDNLEIVRVLFPPLRKLEESFLDKDTLGKNVALLIDVVSMR